MKYPLLQTCLVAAVVGCLSAGLTSSLLASRTGSAPSAAAPTARSTPAAANASDSDQELLARLAELRDENRQLRERIEALEMRPVPADRAPLAVSVVPTTGELDGSPAAAESDAPVLSDDLLGSVEQALERIRAEERVEEERRQEQREAERLEERLARLAQELGLSSSQVRELRTLWSEEDAAREELRRIREQSGDREAYKSARDELREKNRATLARILSPSQLQSFREREEKRDEKRSERPRRDG